MNKRGAVLIICYMVIIVLTVLGAAFFMSSVSEGRAVNKYYDSTQAFWLAETGVNRAIYLLKNNLSLTGGSIPGVGDYNFDSVVDLGGGSHEITVRGSVPSATSSTKVERVIEFRVNKYIPPGFYDHAIYAAGNLERKGNVIGTVVYGGTPSGSYKDPQPTSETHDPSISPLALLDFEQLRTISKAQGNYHDSDHLSGPFPSSFWHTPPSGGSSGVPNVVFLEGNFTIKGNDKVGGFFVVGGGGDVVYDATLAGTVGVDGCIYTRGNFTIKGGGGAGINIDSIWVGGTTTLGGSSVVTYNQAYMDALIGLGINADVQITSWQEEYNLH